MFQDLWGALRWGLGLELESKDLNVWHMSLRALIVFVIAIGMLRMGNKRFMGKEHGARRHARHCLRLDSEPCHHGECPVLPGTCCKPHTGARTLAVIRARVPLPALRRGGQGTRANACT